MSSSTHLGPVKYIDCSCYHDSKAAVHIEPTENFDFSAALLSEYDVLDKILRYLSYRDLSNIGQVNDTWAIIADAELQKRLSPNLFSFGLTCYNAPDSITAKPSLCLVLMECNTVKLNTYICIHKEPGSEKRKSVIEFLEDDLLTTTCPIVALTCSQISSSYTGNKALNGMAFPCIPNIKLAVFRLKDSKNIPTILDENIGTDNNVACLLCYALCGRKKKHLHDLLTEIENRQPSVNFALGGGLVRGMQIFNVNKKKSSLQKKDEIICIAFCKPKTEEVPFNTYSIVIPETAERTDEIEHYFIELKKHYVPRKYSIAFRITCVSRSSEMQTEISLFTKHFPNIELLGFNGEGEIGWDFYKSDVGTEEVKRLKLGKQNKVFRSLTTIIVLLTWGRKIK